MGEELQRIALVRAVVDKYREEDKSLRRTAAVMGLSATTVRKMLVTAREYDTPRKREIDELRKQGLGVEQIAKKLGISAKAIDSYLPYKRGTYLIPSQTKNAETVRQCQARKKSDTDAD